MSIFAHISLFYSLIPQMGLIFMVLSNLPLAFVVYFSFFSKEELRHYISFILICGQVLFCAEISNYILKEENTKLSSDFNTKAKLSGTSVEASELDILENTCIYDNDPRKFPKISCNENIIKVLYSTIDSKTLAEAKRLESFKAIIEQMAFNSVVDGNSRLRLAREQSVVADKNLKYVKKVMPHLEEFYLAAVAEVIKSKIDNTEIQYNKENVAYVKDLALGLNFFGFGLSAQAKEEILNLLRSKLAEAEKDNLEDTLAEAKKQLNMK